MWIFSLGEVAKSPGLGSGTAEERVVISAHLTNSLTCYTAIGITHLKNKKKTLETYKKRKEKKTSSSTATVEPVQSEQYSIDPVPLSQIC